MNHEAPYLEHERMAMYPFSKMIENVGRSIKILKPNLPQKLYAA